MTAPANGVFDIAIGGGSFAGLALALAIVRASHTGLTVAVVDRSLPGPDPMKPDPRAFALAAGSRRLLEAIGVWPAVASEAEPVSGIDITDSDLGDFMRPLALSYDTTLDGEPQMLILPADTLRAALVDAVLAEPDVTLVTGSDIAGLDMAPGYGRIRLRNGDSIAGRLVVAADGARSTLRDAAGISIVGGHYGQRGIITVVSHGEEHGGRAVQHFLPGGPFAMLPLPAKRTCITWSECEAEATRILALDDVAFLAEVQLRAGWQRGELALEGPRASWPLATHLARGLVASRLALIGDAARAVHPIAGQGVNLGFRDVAALVEALADGVGLGLEAGDVTILERYERWRRADGTQAAMAFSALNALFSNTSRPLRAVRTAGLGLVDRLPGVKEMLVREAAGTTGLPPKLLTGGTL